MEIVVGEEAVTAVAEAEATAVAAAEADEAAAGASAVPSNQNQLRSVRSTTLLSPTRAGEEKGLPRSMDS